MNKSKALVFVYTFLIVLCFAFVWIAAQNFPPQMIDFFNRTHYLLPDQIEGTKQNQLLA